MNTSPDDILDATKLQALIVASIHTLKRRNKKCGTDEVFQLVTESVEKDINRKFFNETLQQLIENQKVKESCYGNRNCLSIPKEDQPKKIETSDNDNKDEYSKFKNQITNKIEEIRDL